MKRILIYFLLFILILLIFLNSNTVLTSTTLAVDIWLKRVFPYLFIMMIINDLLINTNIIKYFKNINIYIIFISLLSGNPTSTYIIKELTNKKYISVNNANILLMYTHFSNPLFLYTMLNSIFNDLSITIKLMIIHYLSNIIICLFSRNKINVNINEDKELDLSKSISKSMNTSIMVLGTICFYMVVSSIILEAIPLNNILSILFKGTLELTQGLNSLINTNIPHLGKILITMYFLSFGGLSIHTQVKCILGDSTLDYKYFLKGRVIATLIAITLAVISNA